MVDVGDAAGQRVIDGNHGQVSQAFAHGIKRILERGAGYGLHIRVYGPAGEVGISPFRTLEGYFFSVF
jgi:hypothetical protein